jgi:MYXO-CTERM domain-containing protein
VQAIQGSGPATYQSAGGLGPYDPSKAPAPNTGSAPGTGGAKTPGFEAVALAGALGAVALLLARRRA